MAHPNNGTEIRKVQAYLKGAGAEVNRLGIVPRLPYRHPFDILGLAMVSKVFALSRACLKLLVLNFPDEAFGLSRSMVECATILRYLTAEPDLQYRRSRNFVRFAMADKAFWAHYALEHSTEKEKELEIRRYMEGEGIVADANRIKDGDRPKRTPLRTSQLLWRAGRAGSHIGTLCEAIHRQQGEVGVRRILGVLSLAKKYGAAAVDEACAAALEIGEWNGHWTKSQN